MIEIYSNTNNIQGVKHVFVPMFNASADIDQRDLRPELIGALLPVKPVICEDKTAQLQPSVKSGKPILNADEVDAIEQNFCAAVRDQNSQEKPKSKPRALKPDDKGYDSVCSEVSKFAAKRLALRHHSADRAIELLGKGSQSDKNQ